MEFDQTFTINGFWGKDKRFKIWGQKVNVKVTVGSNIPPKCTFWPC